MAGLDLWLITVPGQCLLTVSQDAVDRGLADPHLKEGTPALADGGSLAYLAKVRPVDDERTVFEVGAYGHGPRGAELAEQLADHLRVWDREHRHGPGPVLTVHPASTTASDLPPGHVLRKHHTTMVLSWPEDSPIPTSGSLPAGSRLGGSRGGGQARRGEQVGGPVVAWVGYQRDDGG